MVLLFHVVQMSRAHTCVAAVSDTANKRRQNYPIRVQSPQSEEVPDHRRLEVQQKPPPSLLHVSAIVSSTNLAYT
jgi:hypothetical protein